MNDEEIKLDEQNESNEPVESAGTEQSQTVEVENDGLLSLLYGVITHPVATAGIIRAKKPVALAFLVAIIIAMVAAIPSYFVSAFDTAMFTTSKANPAPFDPRTLILIILILTPFTTAISLVFSGLIYHGIASVLKDGTKFKGLISNLGFNHLPMIFVIPLSLLLLTKNFVGIALYIICALGLQVWTWFLNVIAIRENYELSTGKAVLAFLLPIIVLTILIFIIIGLAFAAVFGVASQTIGR